jgi:hypothetical protein
LEGAGGRSGGGVAHDERHVSLRLVKYQGWVAGETGNKGT